jgi:hypothetical protein
MKASALKLKQKSKAESKEITRQETSGHRGNTNRNVRYNHANYQPNKKRRNEHLYKQTIRHPSMQQYSRKDSVHWRNNLASTRTKYLSSSDCPNGAPSSSSDQSKINRSLRLHLTEHEI